MKKKPLVDIWFKIFVYFIVWKQHSDAKFAVMHGLIVLFLCVLAARIGEYYFLTEAEGLLLNCGSVFRINI